MRPVEETSHRSMARSECVFSTTRVGSIWVTAGVSFVSWWGGALGRSHGSQTGRKGDWGPECGRGSRSEG